VTVALVTPSDLDPEQIRQATDRVLSEYAQAEPGLLAQALRWVLDQVAAIVSGLISAGGGGVGVALLIALVGGVAVIAWRLVRRVRTDRGHQARPGTIGGRTAQDWRADAQRHEDAREWASALRCHYRALLADLIAAEMIDEIAGRTARGYLHDVIGAAPDAAQPMTAVTAAFEAAWYDRREVTQADVRALRDAAAAVRARLLVPA
jgi:hypothetical protein